MPRIAPVDSEAAPPEARAAADAHVSRHGRMTNMKRTLLHSLPAFRALMEWYPLRDTVQPFLGERLTTVFAHAISAQTDCLICSTFFRRMLIQTGENPERLRLDERETAVVDFGRALAVTPHEVPESLYRRLEDYFTPAQIVTLTAFGALMVATNVVNNALGIELDEYLHAYRKGAREGATVAARPG
ncbi:MAG: carboxymuconolactone decarboxylase family protein [Gemmatimonadales bacterium]